MDTRLVSRKCQRCAKPFSVYSKTQRHCSRKCAFAGSGLSAESFWARVEKRGPDECWEWTGCRAPNGYGRVSVKRDNKWRTDWAHRLAFEFTNGVRGEVVRHKCDNPPCCNPDHLLNGTNADNMRDMAERNRRKGIVGAHGEHLPARLRRFSVADVARIRAEVAHGPRGTSTRLAREYGTSRVAICDIVKLRRWKHDA